MLFSMYHKEVKSSVWRSCVEARHLSLNRWLSLESHRGFSSSALLNFITLLFALEAPYVSVQVIQHV